MTLDVVNAENKKVGSVDLNDAVFAGPVKTDLIWESVVRQNASERRGTHMTKNRALVSGGGKKPYKQKGTGRAAGRVDADAALAPRRHGVRAAAAQLRLRAAEEGRARRAARGAAARLQRRRRDGRRRARARPRSRRSRRPSCCKRLGATGKTLRRRREARREVQAVGAQHRRRARSWRAAG